MPKERSGGPRLDRSWDWEKYGYDNVRSCTSCARAKTPRHRPYGLLKQLPVPEKPWNSISMDFIEQLPSSTGFTAILVMVDWLSKQAIFIPTHDTITSLELVKLFLLHVFSKHGVPAHCQVRVYSGRGSGQVRTKADEGGGQRLDKGLVRPELGPIGFNDKGIER